MNATSVPASGGIASSLSSHFGCVFMRHIWRPLPTRCFVAKGDRRCAAEILHRDGKAGGKGASEEPTENAAEEGRQTRSDPADRSEQRSGEILSRGNNAETEGDKCEAGKTN